MPNGQEEVVVTNKSDLLAVVLIFLGALFVFWISPVSQLSDSHYSLLVSESLLKHRSFALDHYALPRLEPQAGIRDDYVANGGIWQLELVKNHLYYYFPPGSSILSLPYVALANLFGYSVVNPDLTYSPRHEQQLERGLAAILMAALGVVVFLTARVLLPVSWSLIVAFATIFGTQIWSTTSRALWSHTWEVLLVSLVVLMLVKHEFRVRRLHPILFATVLAWTYFVRPSGAIVVLAGTIYVLLYVRTNILEYLLTGLVWIGLFVAYSWTNFSQYVPSYFKASRLRLDLFPTALAGNLISPSRGLLIYVPILLFVGYLLIRYRNFLVSKRLATMALLVIAGHLILVSSFANRLGDWWGGASYGPRYSSDLVPWFSLLAILGLHEMIRSRRESMVFSKRRWTAEIALASLLLMVSVVINARGALSNATWKWSQPTSDQQMRALLWDWRHPQFLAGLQGPPPLVDTPVVPIGTRLEFSSQSVEKYLWYGWSGAEREFRWTDGKEAAMVFKIERPENLLLTIHAGPFTAGERLAGQNLGVVLNGQRIETLSLQGDSVRQFTLTLPQHLLSNSNTLKFELPNALSPESLGTGNDTRILGIRVEWMELRPLDR
jgi:hypothetical protein